MSDKKTVFPHEQDGVRKGIASFPVGSRELQVYFEGSGPPGTDYSLYWGNDPSPIIKAGTPSQILTRISELVSDECSRASEAFVAFRQKLRDVLNRFGVPSNPAVSDDWIVIQLEKILTNDSGIQPGVYRHYKGRYYFVPPKSGVRSSDGEKLVEYYPLYGEFKKYVRPISMFFEEVEVPEYSYKGPRFQYIGDATP
ncbi:MAG: hypothetical protein G01um101470_373 [Parcubacteria group bacterium Gr01-1014_70]|nr:MAG: hypothetical protein G01um101470_373 [Parcubacteria group bacterium Gr01-1014_70]